MAPNETSFSSEACFDLETAVVSVVDLFFQLMQTTFGSARAGGDVSSGADVILIESAAL